MPTPTTDGKVFVAYCHSIDPTSIAPTFMASFINMLIEDLNRGVDCRIFGGGTIHARPATAAGLANARNSVTDIFRLHGAEWLLWVDTDMGFAPDSLERLIEAADPVERPVMGALCFGQNFDGADDIGTPVVAMFPTIYKWHQDESTFSRAPDYPRDQVIQCAGTGAAFLLIHRTVVDTLHERWGATWFSHVPHPEMGQFSEDLSFCLKLAAADIPVHVHTGVKTSHAKATWLNEARFDTEALTVPAFAVIPTRGVEGHVEALVRQIQQQGEARKVVVCDNGCNRRVRNWLDSQEIVEVIDCPDMGIHEMWNAGWDWVLARYNRANIAFLNDDIVISEAFLSRLGRTLRSNPILAVVGPNYDRRPVDGVVMVDGICAGRYDGTGGLSGFAFMVQAETPYRFPEDMKWWYGDNDLVMSTLASGLKVGIVTSVDVTHVDGGSRTGDWDSMAEQLSKDRAVFEARWVPA